MSNAKKSDDKAWKTPNEVNLIFFFFNLLLKLFCHFIKYWYVILQIIRLQRLKQKQKALQARLERPAYNTRNSPSKFQIVPSEKRKNPFLE